MNLDEISNTIAQINNRYRSLDHDKIKRIMSAVAQNLESIPSKVAEAFAGHATLPFQTLARAMEMDVKTLSKHRELGNLPVHIKGVGIARRHYVCTLADVAEFYRRTGEACQSSRSENPRSINLTSRSKVYAFPVQPSAGMNVTRRITRKPVARKPNASPSKSRQPESGL